MNVKFVKAFNGDCILISFTEYRSPRNIIIDGGPSKTYKSSINRKGGLYEAIEGIKNQKEFIDLLILTHFDDDHIGGVLNWFKKDKDVSKIIKNVWFNSGKEIAKMLNQTENPELEINDAFEESTTYTSVRQGVEFEEFLRKHNIWDGKVIIQGHQYELFGMKFKILSPNKASLEKLLKEYKKTKDYFTRGGEYDFKTYLSDFIKEENDNDYSFVEDKSIPNGSSIAFILEYEDRSFLFLGDAHPSIVIDGLNKFGYNKVNVLEVELMKVSHHGSKHNTNRELLEIIKTDNFLISSDGSKHGLPNKRTLARIINNNPNAHIYFNYDLKDKVFDKQDWEDYPSFRSKMKMDFEWM